MKDEKKKQAASEEVKAEAKADSAKASDAGKTEDEAEARDAAEFIKKLAETAEAVEQLTAKLDAATKQYTRLQADFDNYRRRTREEQARLSTTVTGDVLKKFLPVLDNIDRALAHMEKDKNAGPYLEGFNLLKKGLEKVLADFGVKEMDAQGKAFDPHFHEALMEIQSDDVDKDTVSAVLQKGYMMGDAVLRPAKVQVAHN